MRRALGVAAAVLAVNACTSSAYVEVAPAHTDDHVQWLSQSPPVLRIECDEGIGTAMVKTATVWPDTLEVELTLAALEGFTLRSGSEVHRLEVTKEGQVLVEPEGSKVLHMNSFRAIESSQIFRLSLQLGHLAEPAGAVRIEWVDFYR